MTKVQQAKVLYEEARAVADDIQQKCEELDREGKATFDRYLQLSSQASALFNGMTQAREVADIAFDVLMEAMRQERGGTQVQAEEN